MAADIDDESSMGMWPGPRISFPANFSHSGFYVEAQVPNGFQGASSWRLQVWGSSDPHYSHGSGNVARFWIAPGDIRFGQFRMKCDYKLNSFWSNWTETGWLTMKVPQPLITKPLENSSHLVAPQLFGNCIAWAKVAAKNVDGSHLADAYVNGEEWALDRSWRIGKHQVRAVQTVNDVPSDLSDIRTFYISPPEPSIIQPLENSTHLVAPQLFGNCMAGAMVAVKNIDGSHLADVDVNGGGWFFQYSGGVGKHQVRVVQTVEGATSDLSEVRTFYIKPPKPTIRAPGNTVSGNESLTITGVLAEATSLQMSTDINDSVDGSFSPASGTTRIFTPKVFWTAGTTLVRVVQTVGSVTSDPSDLVSVRVKPAKPTLTAPANPASVNEALTITGVLAEATSLQMSTDTNDSVDGSYSPTSGTTRIFTPKVFWIAGTTLVRVVQTVGSVTSDPSNLVSVRVKPAKPTITAPANPASVNEALTITGVLAEATSLQMSTDINNSVDGSFSPTSGTTRIFTPKVFWAAGTTLVKVVQTVGSVTSDPSNLVSVRVKPAKPTITAPANPASVNEALTITGVLAQTTSLQMTTPNEIVDGNFSPSGPTRTFTPKADWPAGETQVKVVQSVGVVTSEPSNVVTIRIAIKPPKPQITQPLPNSSHLANVTVEGTCEVGAEVLVKDADGCLLDGEVSYDQMKWFFKYQWQPDKHQIQAVQTLDGQPSDPTDVLDFYIRPPQLVIEQPHSPVAVRGELKISNVSSGIVALRMSTHVGIGVDGEFAGDGATRTFTPKKDWSSGENKVEVVQRVNSVDSDPSDLCTFTVESVDKPDIPKILKPQKGARTSRYPTIKVAGLPGALHTVRLEESDELHEEAAGADGVLEFTLSSPLVPGEVAIQVMQASGGADSDWSVAHGFEVKEQPKTPTIIAPTQGNNAKRKPQIRGTGQTGGLIVLHHENELETPFASAPGSTGWSWTANEEWPVDTYTVRARQTADGDCSEWTEPRTFNVIDSRYAIGDASPVLGTPVVGTGQSVLLRVQVISGVSGEAAGGVEVEWRINGETDILATTETDPQGWTFYRYTPANVGKSEVLADITSENAGVVMTELFQVTAVPHDDWAKEAELYLDGERVDLAVSELMLLRKSLPYKLELKVKDDSVLIGSTITLEDLWGAVERGLTFIPDLGTPQTIGRETSTHWSIFTEKANSGVFGLNLTNTVLPDWQLPGCVQVDVTELVRVEFDTFTQAFGGKPAYPCLGATHTVTVKPKQQNPLVGHDVTLELSDEAVELGVSISPDTPQTLGIDGVSWSLNCAKSDKSGNFAVWLSVAAWNAESAALPMSLGHNKVKITEKYGPTQESGGFGRYGIRATSTFTELPAGDVPVTVVFPHGSPTQRETIQDGWLYVRYDGDIPALSIENRYDGSTVKL